MICIYRHVHRESGKCYVGQTKSTMERRWKGHVYFATKPSHEHYPFQRAIAKHGPDAFEHEVLEVCSTREASKLADQPTTVAPTLL